MKQQLISIKRLVLAMGMLVMFGMSSLALADEITITYTENGVSKALTIDGNSSDTDLALAASLIGATGVTLTSAITESTADTSLADLAASIASKASTGNGMSICKSVADSSSGSTNEVMAVCAKNLPDATGGASNGPPAGVGGGRPTMTPPSFVPVASPNRP